jgi:hypothetical protein
MCFRNFRTLTEKTAFHESIVSQIPLGSGTRCECEGPWFIYSIVSRDADNIEKDKFTNKLRELVICQKEKRQIDGPAPALMSLGELAKGGGRRAIPTALPVTDRGILPCQIIVQVLVK